VPAPPATTQPPPTTDPPSKQADQKRASGTGILYFLNTGFDFPAMPPLPKPDEEVQKLLDIR
jgi:hypothetical protein